MHTFLLTNGRFHMDADEDWVVSDDVMQTTLSTMVTLDVLILILINNILITFSK